ncbi:glycosyltransferase family 2 protein [Geotalea uraniireducens]|nr:glycosyltransferase family 2 protein [Geotalea uraniireducens]
MNPAGLPKISIVTPSFNQGRYLEKTILSVLEQGYPNLEYIIIDGKSSDNSVEIIKKYEKYLKYWVSEEDRGQSHAINKGFAHATGDLLGWLNSDDYYAAGALKTVAETALATPAAGAIVGAGAMVDETGNVFLSVARTAITLESLYNWFDEFFWQPSCFFPKETWKHCGPLDENVHYAMDLDFWIKIAKKFTFTTTHATLSFNLKHPKAKTTEFSYLSHVDAVMVIMRHGAEKEARKLLEEYTRVLHKSALDNEELLIQKCLEIQKLREKYKKISGCLIEAFKILGRKIISI